MPAVKPRGIVLAGGLAAVAMALPATALAQDLPSAPPEPEPAQGPLPTDEPEQAQITVKVKGLHRGKVEVGDKVTGIGQIRPFVPGEEARIALIRKGKELQAKSARIEEVRGKGYGRIKLRTKELARAGAYHFRVTKERSDQQIGESATSKSFSLRFPDLDPGNRGEAVKTFNQMLRKQGYFAPGGASYSSGTSRAVLAFRKVNGMPRNSNATPGIFAKLAKGEGAFKLKYPGAGRHVEVDISRQVLVLAKNGKPQYTFHISSGAPGSPSDRGHYRFYRKDAGYNSLGMYYSVYYNRGEATHGYKSVPNYPASHGCLRNPIPNSVFIYNWISLGMDIWVYN